MPTSAAPASRKYDSPLRRQRALETRARILDEACRMLQASSVRDWHGLTMRGVAEQAGVNERTVYRYFGNERGLRDAVMRRLEEDAGIGLEGMRLGDVADITARIFTHVAAYPQRPKAPLDPTLADAHLRQRGALLGALAPGTSGWSESERTAVAALLDVLWSVGTYERLTTDWDLASDEAIRTVRWAIGLVHDAVRSGRPPS